MDKELYFDVVSDEGAGGLYLMPANSKAPYYYHYSAADLETDKVDVQETNFITFSDFWKHFTSDRLWFCLHPLYIHPEQRPFIKEQLKKVDWNIVTDEKWRDMYQRQWNKVLNNPSGYYKPDRSPRS